MKTDKFEDLSLADKISVAIKAAQLFAITTQVLHTTKMGIRAIRKNALIAQSALMLIATGCFPMLFHPHVWLMIAFAISSVTVGLVSHRRRWNEFCSGVIWNTYSTGASIFAKLPWPDFLRFENRLQRWVDCAFVAISGLLLLPLCHGLGLWLLFASFCEYVVAAQVYDNVLNILFDRNDNQAEAAAMKSLMEREKGKTDAVSLPLTIAETGGKVSAGIALDIEKNIALRRAKRIAVQNEAAFRS